MKFSTQRETLLKQIDTPDPEIAATPRWISPRLKCMGFEIAKARKVTQPTPVDNRASKRDGVVRTRSRHFNRAALTPAQQPWRVDV